jgi:hypothetical protein
MSRVARCVLTLALVPLLSACGAPPEKEMNQARAALADAERAGAERYAADDYQAAVGALKRSETAVSDRDYKLALNYALDARERAQAASRAAAATKVRLRSEADHALAELDAAVNEATARLRGAESARPRWRDLPGARREVAAAGAILQKAREAEAREDYRATIDQATATTKALRLEIARIPSAAAPPPRRKTTR